MKESSTLMYFVHLIEKDLDLYVSKKSEPNGVSFFESGEIQQVSPSEKSVGCILNFARSYEVAKTKSTGYVEMILN